MTEWLRYVSPRYLIQERDGLLRAYEIWMPELSLEIGRVELYISRQDKMLWRTLDHRKCDWRDGFPGREKASQDLLAHCPRTVALVAQRRERLAAKRMCG